jgi:hypothetical protein
MEYLLSKRYVPVHKSLLSEHRFKKLSYFDQILSINIINLEQNKVTGYGLEGLGSIVGRGVIISYSTGQEPRIELH